MNWKDIVDANHKGQTGFFKTLEIMKTEIKKFEELLKKYSELRDSDVILSSDYFDSFGYDIDGYRETLYEATESEDKEWLIEELTSLETQVDHVAMLVDALNGINMRFS